jgi:uncharacterized protein YutE (UPF0331/DUF86 family)
MSPRQFDPGIVHARLKIIRQLLEDLDWPGLHNPQEFLQDRLNRHAVERVLTQLVEIASSINGHVVGARLGRGPESHAESFTLAAKCGLLSKELADELVTSVGMRNVLVHEYVEIDLEQVAAAVPLARDGYRRYLASVAAYVSGS